MALLKIEDPGIRRPVSTDFSFRACLALGFRPFYLLAAGFAAVAIPVWVLALTGHITLPVPGVLWHAHEMIFGFAVAVIIGFLYTAGRNWTGMPTPSGNALLSLAVLWCAGRIAMLSHAGIITALVDFAFLPAAALALAQVLIKAKNTRNYFVVVLLTALALSNAGFHAARLELISLPPLRAIWFALALITLLETIIGGRVIPLFTSSALRGVRQWQHPYLNSTAIALTGMALLLWVLDAGFWGALLALAAAITQIVRSVGWNPWATRRTPLLWILHLGHWWIPIALLLMAAAQQNWLPHSAAIHALAIGATGGLIIGMMTRTALGHTGRMLIASKIETTAYSLVQLAALSRVMTLTLLPATALVGVHIAASLWTLAFGLYVYRYYPLLTRPRPDGKPG